MGSSPQEQRVEVGGRTLRLSNLDKVLYPATGTTKRDVIAYASEIAPVMLPHCRDRPATRKRWPDGVGEDGTGASFFQKDLGPGAPDWVATHRIEHTNGPNVYPLVNDEATLVWLAQLAALELHVPQWRVGPDGVALPPDRLVFDLDPGEGVTLTDCAEVAFLVRDILRDAGLDTVPVTSGSKGIHLYAGLDGTVSSEQASALAKELARALEADHPDTITSQMKRSLRPGKVFIDWSQNHQSKTTVAPYSLRGRVRPWVAAPRTWRELASPHLRQLEYREVLQRVRRRGDPLAHLAPRTPAADRLARYRSMRDAGSTPEPVPDAAPAPRTDVGDPVFVIQRHEARRLHFDFRLEHDGVLVSWALPKGVPNDPRRNHLAVPTEDHPMEYRTFEGTIPKGEYGAGEVRIWDSGTYTAEKWRDGEVIATLRGRPDGGLGGERRFALFRTQGADADGGERWMIHLMEAAGEGAEAASGNGSGSGSGNSGRESGRGSGSGSGGADLETARANGRRARRADRTTTERKHWAPMLATRSRPDDVARLDPEEWAFEMKWDGMRALAEISGGEVRLTTRSGAEVSASYPELRVLADVLPVEQAVLDGEIVAFGANGAPSFHRLQERMGVTGDRSVARLRRSTPVSYLIFDVLELNGQPCIDLSYRDRRALLDELLRDDPGTSRVALPPVFAGDGTAALAESAAHHLEGVVAKRWRSPYRSGERGADWLKAPVSEATEVLVVGWRESGADPEGIASLLLADHTESGLVYAGRVGTGFSQAERRRIRAQLSRIERKTAPLEVPELDRRGAHWVTPKLVAEVRARERTADGRFRHPVWRGFRPDMTVDD